MNNRENNRSSDFPLTIVAGNGFEPTVDDLQGLLDVGHIKKGTKVQPVSSESWNTREDAKLLGKTLVEMTTGSSDPAGDIRMRLREYQEREFLIVSIGTAEEKKRATKDKRLKRSKKLLLMVSTLTLLVISYVAVFHVPMRVFFPPEKPGIQESVYALTAQTTDRRRFDGDENGRFDFFNDQTAYEQMIFRNEIVEDKKTVPFSDLSTCVPAVERLLEAGPQAVDPLVDALLSRTVLIVLPEGMTEHVVPIRISKFQENYRAPGGDPLANCLPVTLGRLNQSEWIELTLCLMGEPAIEPLKKLRWHQTPRVHWSVVKILEHLGEEPTKDPVPEEAIPLLLGFLNQDLHKQNYANTMLESVSSEVLEKYKQQHSDETREEEESVPQEQ